ncbi:MAG: glucose-6-phosphate isomerase [Firmicutes bacterium]|nr:glucose-6-phosphate isomerase [Bacillota bacterium]
MQLKFDYNNIMQYAIGVQGVKDAEIAADMPLMQKAFDEVMSAGGNGWQEWMRLPDTSDAELTSILQDCESIRKKAESLVVLGIGGSALGPLSVLNALLHLRHNELPAKKRAAPKFYIEDNIDPERMRALFDVIDLNTAYFNVITKSGETSETLAQFLIIYDALKKALGKKEAKKRILVTTTIGKGTLYNIAQKEGFKIFGIGNGVGGRFSVFSAVGLVPFAILGVDIRALLAGARAMAAACKNPAPQKNPALITAYLQVKSMQKGRNISVMMPYSDALKYMADFYCQLWGESLGKAADKTGKQVFTGQTPTKAVGVTDQHSQIQLYTEGPFDKVVTFIGVDNFRNVQPIASDPDIDGCGFLKGQTLNDLLKFEKRATRFALQKALRANFTITLPEINAHTVGELLQYFMLQTAFAGALLNIDAYNQPGVEEGKIATFALLGRTGYEQKLEELQQNLKSADYLIEQ